ncbi:MULTISPECIES: hypothetical protein [Empedobacter]|uniref:Lipoprotein n=1 Tax=Empedobacter falsenii TaxID=343874 RepID=A0A376G4R0_9FLAO|nr:MULTISPECIES: hypothetical protein [Empedobacter]MDM1041843.1 hypothetical protein [Empedobacter brevis]MDM1135773.1 hypothetical protein [Empedobacter sp. R750]RRT89899.1 hypothetical protein EGI89_10560 [Empedobacter falsenii]RRT89946.1 hypothetical protein EGI88_10490 [Empedobacter falsenii]STD54670.1 Uncharacterised protein [Empedobacter falsenii]
MKKLFLAAAVLGVVSLSSCKSEKEKVDAKVENTQENVANTVEDQVEAGKETMDKVADVAKDLPTFSDPKATEWVNQFNQLAADMKVAATAGDQAKLAELSKKAIDLQQGLKSITQTLKPEDAKKLQDWTAEIQKQLNK